MGKYISRKIFQTYFLVQFVYENTQVSLADRVGSCSDIITVVKILTSDDHTKRYTVLIVEPVKLEK